MRLGKEAAWSIRELSKRELALSIDVVVHVVSADIDPDKQMPLSLFRLPEPEENKD